MDHLKRIADESADTLCSRPEGDFFDRKALGIDGRAIQKIVVAFANSDGGEVAVGIADTNQEPDTEKRWQGADTPETFNPLLQAVFELDPAAPFRHEFVQHPERRGIVLRLFVDKSGDVCKTAAGTVYQRVGAQCLPIRDPQRIAQLAFAKGARSYEDTQLDGARPELIVDSEAMREFVIEARDAIDPLSFCVNEGLITADQFVPTAAGVLLFADNPPAHFPKRCGIKIVYYDTRLDEPERDHLKENLTVSGPLYSSIHQAANKITEILSSIHIHTADGMKRVEYPREAIWEILVNAVIHRDYSISDDIQIRIFQNRVEIMSPGRLPGFVTIENILDTRYSRNPKLVRTLNRYRNAPNKDLGEGLNTAFQKMQEWKLKNPEFSERNNTFIVLLPHSPLARPEELVLQFLQSHPSIKNKEARGITGIKSENQMKEVFYRLRDDGYIRRVDGLRGNAAAWERTDKDWHPDKAE